MDDADLIARLLSRDRQAVHQFYRTYAPKLARFIGRKVENAHDGEEILQDALFAFLEAIRDFHGESSLSTFLFSIANHKIIDYYRRKKIRHIVFSRAPYLDDLISPLLDPQQELDAVMVREKLKRAFSLILPVYTMVLKLKYQDDRSVREIAGLCKWTLKKTESLLFRARKAFVREYRAL